MRLKRPGAIPIWQKHLAVSLTWQPCKSEYFKASSSICQRPVGARQCVAGESMPGDSERSLVKTVEVKPGLCWRSQYVGDSQVLRYLKKESCAREVGPDLRLQS